jgi:hypothetical protein
MESDESTQDHRVAVHAVTDGMLLNGFRLSC